MLNKLFLLLFTTYVTTTFLNYFPLTKLQIHHIGQESKIDSFWMEMVVRRARLAKIRNDCTNQSITDKQIQVWIKRGNFYFLFFFGGGRGVKTNCKVRKTIKSVLQSEKDVEFIIASTVKINNNFSSNLRTYFCEPVYKNQ